MDKLERIVHLMNEYYKLGVYGNQLVHHFYNSSIILKKLITNPNLHLLSIKT